VTAKTKLAACFITMGFGGAGAFKLLLENPAFEKLPNGNFGELYGPVSYFRVPIYTVTSVFIVFGVVLLVFSLSEKTRN